MHPDDPNDFVDCLDCGATIVPSLDRAFALSNEAFLCFECAARRGGAYDVEKDRWTTPPNVSDEPDERRPHA
jgi:hypothetical protein